MLFWYEICIVIEDELVWYLFRTVHNLSFVTNELSFLKHCIKF